MPHPFTKALIAHPELWAMRPEIALWRVALCFFVCSIFSTQLNAACCHRWFSTSWTISYAPPCLSLANSPLSLTFSGCPEHRPGSSWAVRILFRFGITFLPLNHRRVEQIVNLLVSVLGPNCIFGILVFFICVQAKDLFLAGLCAVLLGPKQLVLKSCTLGLWVLYLASLMHRLLFEYKSPAILNCKVRIYFCHWWSTKLKWITQLSRIMIGAGDAAMNALGVPWVDANAPTTLRARCKYLD